MKTLSSEDAFFLYMETPDQHQHTVGTMILDPSTAPKGFSVETLVDKLEQVIKTRPEFCHKLVKTPFSMTPPVLVEDPDFIYQNHVHRIAVPLPGSFKQLVTLIEDIASTALDQRRPLWEAWFISGIEGGKLAVMFKSHHCLTDAANGTEFLGQWFDLEPILPSGINTRQIAKPPQQPSMLKVTYEAVKSQWRYQPGYFNIMGRTLRSLQKRRRMFTNSSRMSDLVPAFLEGAPKLKINAPITSNRSAAMATLSMADVKMIKNFHGITVNDVVVAACTIALRKYLIATDDLPDQPLICYLPVSLILKGRRAEKQDQGNQVGTMAIRLPVQIEDQVETLQAVHESTAAAKKVFDGSFENLLQGYIGVVPPAVADWALKQYLNRQVIKFAPANCNVVISNFPGSPVQLYMAGARLEATFPMGPIISGQGPNITFMSYAGKLNFSVQACREHVPDIWMLADAIVKAIDTLAERTRKQSHQNVNRNKKRSNSAVARKKSATKAKAGGSASHKAKVTGPRKTSVKNKPKAANKTIARARGKS